VPESAKALVWSDETEEGEEEPCSIDSCWLPTTGRQVIGSTEENSTIRHVVRRKQDKVITGRSGIPQHRGRRYQLQNQSVGGGKGMGFSPAAKFRENEKRGSGSPILIRY